MYCIQYHNDGQTKLLWHTCITTAKLYRAILSRFTEIPQQSRKISTRVKICIKHYLQVATSTSSCQELTSYFLSLFCNHYFSKLLHFRSPFFSHHSHNPSLPQSKTADVKLVLQIISIRDCWLSLGSRSYVDFL